ncbi:MAG: prepilin-type N-terminal cleavage/methylation domain-containing protein [Candidatus Saccharimonadales bacterium]
MDRLTSQERQKRHGFSIVELLVAIIVGGIFVMILAQLINISVYTAVKSRDVTLANAFVEAKSEALRSQGYNAISLGTSDISSGLPSKLSKPNSASLEVTQPSEGLKKLYITISYTNQGTSLSYNYTTYIGELGVAQ